MADPVTQADIDAAEQDFQAKVAAHAAAATAYAEVVPQFTSLRSALRSAYAAEVSADAVLTDLIQRYEAQPVPPVPNDE